MGLSRRQLLKALAGSLVAYSLAGIGVAWGRRVTVIDLGLGKRVVFAPDAHIHSIDRVFANDINKLRPHLVLLGGDIYDRWSDLEEVVETLRLIEAPMLGVLGNHEHWADKRYGKIALEEGLKRLEEAGVTVLFDETTRMAGLDISGLDWRDNPREYNGVTLEGGDLLVVHSPDAFPHVTGVYKLVLAGHTHGGQICLPGPKSVITNSVYGYHAGFYQRRDGLTMYVSRGAGHIIPVRMYCSREILLLL